MPAPEITLRQLQTLLQLQQHSHFRRAAEAMGVTQPSLSAQLQNLESALGVRLVERGRSGVALTPIGREVALRARRISDEAQGIVDVASRAQHELVGTIRLGTTPTLGPYLLPHVVAALHRQHKTLNLYVRESAARDLEYDLLQGGHDVILTQLPVSSAEVVAEELFREPLYVVLAVDNALANEPAVPASAVRGLDVLTLSPNYHLYDQVKSLCEALGARLVRDYEGTSLDALRQMVGMGMGISFLPALYVHSEIKARSEVVVRPLKGRNVSRSIGLAWRKTAGRAQTYTRIGEIIRDVARRKFRDLVDQ